MDAFDTTEYGTRVQLFLAGEPPLTLGPGRPNRELFQELSQLRMEDLFLNTKLVDRQMASCCLAGLWLRHDFLDESHQLSQVIETSSGSYWHGIMHRRELDFGNAKYWFRQVGQHAIFPTLLGLARKTAERLETQSRDPGVRSLLNADQWDAYRFVDLCQLANEYESVGESGGENEAVVRFVRHVACHEWESLFEHCYRAAAGSGGISRSL